MADQEVVDKEVAELEAEPEVEYEGIVTLEKVKIDSGEENEDVMYKKRCRVYRFLPEEKSWVERGRGDVHLLKHKETGHWRIILRQEKTLKLRVNHMINPAIPLTANSGSDRSWVWTAQDFSEEDSEEGATWTFAIRLDNAEAAQEFKTFYEQGQEANRKAAADKKPETPAAAEEEKPKEEEAAKPEE